MFGVPVIKNPLPHSESEIYNPEEDKNYTLYSGTEVIQNRKFGSPEVTALVIRTNFDTMKGSLVKSILFPKPSRFSFIRDSMRFVLVMAIISFMGYGIILPPSIHYGLDTKHIIFKGFNLTSTAVPPTLPAAMTVGIAYALSRLRKNKIYCIAPNAINAAGRVKSIVFDKTGTLTEDSLRFSGVTLSSQGTFTDLIEDVDELKEENADVSDEGKSTTSRQVHNEEVKSTATGKGDSMESLCLDCMVSCHSIAQVEDRFIGDPLEIEMFKIINWEIVEEEKTVALDKEINTENNSTPLVLAAFRPKGEKDESKWIAVLKRFEFSSALQRMSVVAKHCLDNSLIAFVKGSPEMIHSLSRENTIPYDYFDALEKYTKDGLRVLAFGYKKMPILDPVQLKTIKREDIECDLTFIGFLIMENKIKQETYLSIENLQEADITTVMATGDNGLTGISVGRNCGIISSRKTVYLAERINSPNGEKIIKWLKIDVSVPYESVLQNKTNPKGTVRQFLKESVVTLSHLSGFGDGLKGEKKKLDESEISQIIEQTPWEEDPDTNFNEFEIAISGTAFQMMIQQINDKEGDEFDKKMNTKLILHAKVFARMSPDHKAMLVETIQKNTKYMVAMCGDGANDCKALKTADAGLSLSEAEASIAAPFTSKIPNISPMIELLKEGRASLVTSFNVFKFLCLYALIEYSLTVFLYAMGSDMTTYEYIYIDLFIVIPVSMTMSNTEPYPYLSK